MDGKNRRKVQYVVTDTGERVSVVLPVEDYEELLEDLADLAAIAERRTDETVDHSKVIERLKADGLL
jgi:PHD/YefM family antitoxin component YafN of YafNO toxin-antitoxin module